MNARRFESTEEKHPLSRFPRRVFETRQWERDMVRSDLLTLVARDNAGLTGKAVDTIVSAFFEAITAQLAAGGRVELRGVGAFSTRQREGRTGRNPRSGALVEVERKRALHFKPGKGLAERVDASFTTTSDTKTNGAPPKRRTVGG